MTIEEIRRSPRGERGLKQHLSGGRDSLGLSLPTRGAGIETPVAKDLIAKARRSPRGERGLKLQ